ncbi:MAG: sulfotransferase family protein [Solirubrobacteraceae bacterium]
MASRDAQRYPDFFIVGHSKSGTTALYEMLRRHPQIFMSEVKEPIYFAGELPRNAHRYTVPANLQEYLALFDAAAPGQRTGEASASYLKSPTAAKRIAEVQPDARIIAILREPASFLHSFHLQCVQAHYETEKDFAKALSLEDARREGRQLPPDSPWPQELMYSEHVHYVDQLRRFHDVFAPEQVLVLIYDDFREQNEQTVRRVLRFLDVDDSIAIETTEANPTVRMRSQRADDILYALSMGHGSAADMVKRAVSAVTPQRFRRRALSALQRRVVYDRPDPPDEQLMQSLRRRFKGEVVALSDYLERDLVTLWGYDRLD